MKKAHKKALKKKHRNGFRNSASPMHPVHARNARTIPTGGASRADKDESGKRTLKVLGGAGITAAACALVARERWLPPTWVTAVVGGVGALAGVIGKSDTIRSVGNGMMSAAGAQFGLLMIDNHNGQSIPSVAAVATPRPADKPRGADGLPAGALEAAYERARRRLALSQAASQMAA